MSCLDARHNIYLDFQREGWSALSSTAIWRQLVDEIRKAGRDHGAMAEVYSANITGRCVLREKGGYYSETPRHNWSLLLFPNNH